MTRRTHIRLLLVAFALCCGFGLHAQPNKALFHKMLTACQELSTAKYCMAKSERLKNGTYFQSEVIAKLRAKPLSIYLYCLKPNPGAEALIRINDNKGKVLVHPNKFPYINLNLSPDNFILREHEHHSIREMGFGYIASLLEFHLTLDRNIFYNSIQVEDNVEWEKRSYYRMTISNSYFAYVPYIVKKDEDLIEIARRLFIPEYLILCNNPGIKEYDDVREGQKIIVPNMYAKKIVMLIDKVNFLPLSQEIYDDKGLFEKYEYRSFIFNPVIAPEEFTADYKSYGF